MAFLFTRLARYGFVLVAVYAMLQYFFRWKSYHISPKVFRLAAQPLEGLDGLSNANKLRNELIRAYDSSIREMGWEAMYGGGFDLRVNFLYTAPTEFVAVFHAPHSTTGFSGWHWFNSTCTVMNGQVVRSALTAEISNKETFSSGKNFRNNQFERFTFELAPDTFVACYGRGAIPFSSIWLAAGSLAKGDPVSFARVVFGYTNLCMADFGGSAYKTFQDYKARATAS